MAAAAVAQGGGRTQGKAFAASPSSLSSLSSSQPAKSSLVIFSTRKSLVGVRWEFEEICGRFWGLLVGSLQEEAASISMDEESVSEMSRSR